MNIKKEYIILFLFLPLIAFEYLGIKILINLIFYLLIISIFVFSIYYRENKTNGIYKELKNVNVKLLDGECVYEVLNNTVYLKKGWDEYKEKFFENKTNIDPEEIFNEINLLKYRINLEWYTYIPNLFITIGIIGTFLGLSLGLRELLVVDILSTTTELLSELIKALLGNVSTSFYTSLYGMYYSIIFYFEFSNFYTKFVYEIDELNNFLRNKFVYNLEIEKIENIRNEFLIQNKKLDNLIETFERELKLTLNRVFNDDYVTAMNKVQLEFIKNSDLLNKEFNFNNNNMLMQLKELLKKSEELSKIFTNLNISSENINKFNTSMSTVNDKIFETYENLKELTNTYYSKEQLQYISNNIREYIDISNDNLKFISKNIEGFKIDMSDSLNTFYNSFKSLEYNEIKNALKELALIISTNKEMIYTYNKIYNGIKYDGMVLKEEIDNLSSDIKELIDSKKLLFDVIKNEISNNNDNINVIKEDLEEEVVNYRNFVLKTKNIISNDKENIKNIIDVNLKELYLRINEVEKYLKNIENKERKKVSVPKYIRAYRRAKLRNGNRDEKK